MTNDTHWKQFEELVGAIESVAAPRGAVVKCDDHLPDVITGESRQVDVSIRFRIGTSDVLILIECRDRNRNEDVRWVEEMVMKLRNLAASKIILVSATGFTQAAKVKAEHYGVELRELSELRVAEIEDWFLPDGVVHLFREVEDAKCSVELASEPGKPVQIDASDPCLVHALIHTPFPAVVFLNFLEMRDPKRLWAVPLDGSKSRVSFEFNGTDPDLIPVPLGVPKPEGMHLRLLRGTDELDVTKLTLSLVISYEANAFARGDGKHHVYGAPGTPKVQHSQFEGKVFGLPVTFEHQSTDGQTSATVKFPSGIKLPSTWVGLSRDDSTKERRNPKDENA
jgi:hypothetical protein